MKANTREDYRQSCAYWMKAIGATMIEDMDYEEAKSIKRGMEDKGRSVAFIHRKFTMLRALAKYGCVMKDAQVRKAAREVRSYLSDMTIQSPAARSVTPTREQVLAVIEKADAEGHFAFGTGLLVQWTFAMRGNDVFGHWLPDAGAGGIRRAIAGKSAREERWQDGMTWDMFEDDLSGFTKVVSKTRKSLPEPIRFNLEDAPVLRARLRLLANAGRIGPVFLTGENIPFTRTWRSHLFRKLARKCGIPDEIVMMDTRAGAITDGKRLGLSTEEMRDAAGHMNSATTERYMRGRAETIANVVKIRNGA